jgi:hypothetical protein
MCLPVLATEVWEETLGIDTSTYSIPFEWFFINLSTHYLVLTLPCCPARGILIEGVTSAQKPIWDNALTL